MNRLARPKKILRYLFSQIGWIKDISIYKKCLFLGIFFLFLFYFQFMRNKPCHGFYGYQNGEVICKGLWDFLELFVIPLALTVITIIVTHFWKQKETEVQLENQRENILQQYFRETKGLVFKKDLLQKAHDSPESLYANVLTITLLKRLDGQRKGFVLTFLTNTKLIAKKNSKNQSKATPPLYLKDADFSDIIVEKYTTFLGINMVSAIFQRSKLESTAFLNCEMSGVNFSDSYLKSAHLLSCCFQASKFIDCNMKHSKLMKTDFRRSVFVNTDLRGADIRGTNFEGACFKNTKLEAAIFSKLTKWPLGFEPPFSKMVEKND